MISQLRRRLLVAMLAVLVGGCVTINIYFPAAAAEKAADKIIDEVWQLHNGRDGARKPEPPSTPSQP